MKKFMVVCAVLFLGLFQLINKPLQFLNPLGGRISPLGQATIKLEQKVNTYRVTQTPQIFPVASAAAPYDNAAAYALIDYDTGHVIMEKNMMQAVPIASLTKIMTAVTALDLISPDEVLTATDRAAAVIPTKIAVIPGEKFTLRELLHAALLTSANDAVEVIRDGIDAKYGDEVFMQAMNIKAKYIGLKNTHFMNPQGFDAHGHYSTAEDLAVLTHYALTNYPLINEIVRKDVERLAENEHHRHFVLYNWNGLIGVYPNVYGVKIGNTDDAGMTSVVVSERDGHRLMAVVLGAPGVLERDLWASDLLDYGYEKNYDLPAIGVTETQLRTKYATWVPWS